MIIWPQTLEALKISKLWCHVIKMSFQEKIWLRSMKPSLRSLAFSKKSPSHSNRPSQSLNSHQYKHLSNHTQHPCKRNLRFLSKKCVMNLSQNNQRLKRMILTQAIQITSLQSRHWARSPETGWSWQELHRDLSLETPGQVAKWWRWNW